MRRLWLTCSLAVSLACGGTPGGPSDGGSPDGGSPDGGTHDGGTHDGGTHDGGVDAGQLDAGRDAGSTDAGPPDAGRSDAGGLDASIAFTLTSPAFDAGAKIPVVPFACTGKTYGSGVSPPLAWTGAPAGTRSFALLMDDLSAGNWTHWVLYDIPSTATGLPQGGAAGGILGAEQLGMSTYAGPCPPSGNHTYSFRLHALDVPTLGLTMGAAKATVVNAMNGHVLGQAALTGTVAASDL